MNVSTGSFLFPLFLLRLLFLRLSPEKGEKKGVTWCALLGACRCAVWASFFNTRHIRVRLIYHIIHSE